MNSMALTAMKLCDEIQGAVFAYTQSDEISLLVHNYKRLLSEAWFGNELQKMVSVSAGIASAKMTLQYGIETVFDSRAFILPEAEVANYFIWRQQDASRNSVQMLARSLFSHRECHKLNNSQLQDKMKLEKEINWNDLPIPKKRGVGIIRKDEKWIRDLEIPIFTQDRDYIEKLLEVEEE